MLRSYSRRRSTRTGANTLGILESGYFRDKGGHAVAFVNGASGGPLLPITMFPPFPPFPAFPPFKPLAPLAPLPPLPSLSWSRIQWPEFIGGYGR